MKWYNWLGLAMFILSFSGIHQWIWLKIHKVELQPFEIAVLQGIALILFVINR